MSWFLLDNLVLLPENFDLQKMKSNSKNKITVIDLFAGPGGLGEGFSNCRPNSPFQIAMSVEYEKNAHDTLTLRSFYRKLTKQERELFYYPYITSSDEDTKKARKEEMIQKCRDKWDEARKETLLKPRALGKPDKWKKIRKGEPISDVDDKETQDELEIIERIRQIKSSTTGPLIVIGGPPCQAYSVNGRNRIKAIKDYSPENDERFFLYQEYLRVIDEADPDVFVMENVEGILSAKLATGELIFERIKRELVRPDKIEDNEHYDIYSLVREPDEPATDTAGPLYKSNKKLVINASKFGVPQARKRVILLGIKHKYGPVDDFMREDVLPTPSTSELLSGLPKLRSGISQKSETLNDSHKNWISTWEKNRDHLISILSDKREIERVIDRNNKKLSNFNSKDAEKIRTSFANTLKEVEQLKLSGDITDINAGRGNALFCKQEGNNPPYDDNFKYKYPDLYNWLNRSLDGVPNHDTRQHMISDLQRYMFSASWANAHKHQKSPFPKSKDFPFALSPDHKNWESGNQADRFRTIGSDMVPLTITSHLRKDGHAQIHYDASQNRSLTVREAARIQTFPDDYYFEGTRGWQYQQVGNAVPAFLAKQIANHVLKILEKKGLF
ncbi:DNA cytosine methyltransferase [Methylophaga sp. OBS1]|uniref:DNA cytosine methyltransferase n=1 Tax=Methylophaga sp. OBS1 TaxID=2991933 RepID=UPI0022591B28|nr:DNA (cytosine-5-)-methyltransferase [Methylophaga sp. OBS1]MCX4191017.1 DNA (cytosine-5-)-methyltransferase [Methylophaga sp. OBS1]MCX4192037.1 DNA (cytosine-5-)-methyltransferase [Methylophaga sp. OBS1]